MIWIVHNSIHGNGIRVAELLAECFPGFDVQITHHRDTPPELIADNPVELLIFGTAVRKFVVSWESQRWLRKVNKYLVKNNITIPYIAGFVTHMRDPHKLSGKFHQVQKLMIDARAFENIYPQVLTCQVEEIEGPLKPGVEQTVISTGKKIRQWMYEYDLLLESLI